MAVGILGTGSYLPAEVVTNADRTTRRLATPDEAASDLSAHAARAAIAHAGLTAGDIDFLIVSTSTPDSPQPPTANLVQSAIGADRAVCFDINVGSAGFVFGLGLAHSLVVVNPSARVLIIAADVYSRIVDRDDLETAALFGDGAGAAVVGTVGHGYGILDLELVSRGAGTGLIRVDAGGSRLPASEKTLADGDHFLRMDRAGLRDFVASEVPWALEALLRRTGVYAAAIDHFVPHQADGVLVNELVGLAGLRNSRTHVTFDRYGSPGSASVPVTLDEAARAGALRDGDLVLLAGFGGGMSVGACLLRWHPIEAAPASPMPS
ncbi:3-oxoacyl-ACP synthase III family protein [Paractinoplanes durhamensis]|uniref:3-oxoacyl-[acyl-carrier-protein] synthase 3 n=1 Tax=Paractinoplanes durhamensis TaxID=113563 RepID=A0ABQ3YZ38_9ACTN|nr:ketoacyl-ACP synthase III [Actinoplanes durhamensis]GIE02822.1 3-oxoacyl-[acyl-carrier-protein] synthase 3 [Actinoplanes durhamensis]